MYIYHMQLKCQVGLYKWEKNIDLKKPITHEGLLYS